MTESNFSNEVLIGHHVGAEIYTEESVVDDVLDEFDMQPLFPRGYVTITVSDVAWDDSDVVTIRQDVFEDLIEWYCQRADSNIELEDDK